MGRLASLVPLVVLASSLAGCAGLRGGGEPLARRIVPAALFSDGAVLQQGRPIPVWGRAEPGAGLWVELDGKRRWTRADARGYWRVTLPRRRAGGPHELRLRGASEVVLRDILIGEVWLLGGQSNMGWPLAETRAGPALLERLDRPRLRLFRVQMDGSVESLPDLRRPASWERATSATAGNFSAVGIHFALRLQDELDCPVGLIQSCMGASEIRAWMPRRALEDFPEYERELLRMPLTNAALAEKLAEDQVRFERDGAVYAEYLRRRERVGEEGPPRLQPPQRSFWEPFLPYALFEGMIRPLAPYGLRGFVWYQGEGDTDTPELYERLFPRLIGEWRGLWGERDLPFLYVQLPNFGVRHIEPAESGWARLREAQRRALDVPQTAMAVTIDIGDPEDIHPRLKEPVGRRLALAALATAYGRDLVHSGPLYRRHEIGGDAVRVFFEHVGGGLVVSDGAARPRGFALRGEDSVWVWAEAEIEGETVLVRSDSVARPAALRYAWGDNPPATLANAEGLPASPFEARLGEGAGGSGGSGRSD